MWSRATSARSPGRVSRRRRMSPGVPGSERGRAAVASITGSSWRSSGGSSLERRTSSPSQMSDDVNRVPVRCDARASDGRCTTASISSVSIRGIASSIAGRAGRGVRSPPRLHGSLRRQRLRAQGACDRDRGIRGACRSRQPLDRGWQGRRSAVSVGGGSPGRRRASHGLEPEPISSAGTPPPTSSCSQPLRAVRQRAPGGSRRGTPRRRQRARGWRGGHRGWCQRVGREPTDPRAVTTALERFRERGEGDVVEAARRSANPTTYAAQVSGFARIYGRCARATCDFP